MGTSGRRWLAVGLGIIALAVAVKFYVTPFTAYTNECGSLSSPTHHVVTNPSRFPTVEQAQENVARAKDESCNGERGRHWGVVVVLGVLGAGLTVLGALGSRLPTVLRL